MWAIWFSSLFFWIANLWGEPNTFLTLSDRKFQQNKWTSWEMYSLWNLAHEEYFTRMMRLTSILTCFWISGLVVSVLYGELGATATGPITILWMGIIGLVAGFLFSFPLGFFIQGFYRWTLRKYNIRKQIKSLQDKEGIEAQGFEQEIDECEDKLYSYYYWYYVVAIFVMVVCWGISVNEMQKLPRENYYQMFYWCGAMGIAFFGNIFLMCPLMTLIFGNFSFYQARGFWYNYELGEAFKDSQDS